MVADIAGKVELRDLYMHLRGDVYTGRPIRPVEMTSLKFCHGAARWYCVPLPNVN